MRRVTRTMTRRSRRTFLRRWCAGVAPWSKRNQPRSCCCAPCNSTEPLPGRNPSWKSYVVGHHCFIFLSSFICGQLCVVWAKTEKKGKHALIISSCCCLSAMHHLHQRRQRSSALALWWLWQGVPHVLFQGNTMSRYFSLLQLNISPEYEWNFQRGRPFHMIYSFIFAAKNDWRSWWELVLFRVHLESDRRGGVRALWEEGQQTSRVWSLSACHAHGLHGSSTLQNASQMGLLDVPIQTGKAKLVRQTHSWEHNSPFPLRGRPD